MILPFFLQSTYTRFFLSLFLTGSLHTPSPYNDYYFCFALPSLSHFTHSYFAISFPLFSLTFFSLKLLLICPKQKIDVFFVEVKVESHSCVGGWVDVVLHWCAFFLEFSRDVFRRPPMELRSTYKRTHEHAQGLPPDTHNIVTKAHQRTAHLFFFHFHSFSLIIAMFRTIPRHIDSSLEVYRLRFSPSSFPTHVYSDSLLTGRSSTRCFSLS